MKRAIFDIIVGLAGIASGAVGVWQFLVPPLEQNAFEKGKKEIAQEVVLQLSNAGFDTKEAKTALDAGNIGQAITLATRATLADPVAIAPAVPFELKEDSVIDLPSGQLLSFKVVSIGSDSATISLRADDQVVPELDIGESMILDGDAKCRIDVLSVRQVDNKWVASLRNRC